MIAFDFIVRRSHMDIHCAGTLPSGITVLTGVSGSGKSTFLRSLAGLETPSTGWITCDDTTWFDGESLVPPQKRHVGYMPQGNIVFPHMSVKANITYSKEGNPNLYAQLIRQLGLDHYESQKAGNLSGGEQQRVALGRALYSQPRLLLLDEPLSALDWNLRQRTEEDLVRILRQWDIPCIWVTHNEDEAKSVGDHWWTMNQGLLDSQ